MQEQNKKNDELFKEGLEAFCGHQVSKQEARDVLNDLTVLVKLLLEIEKEEKDKSLYQGGIAHV